MKATINGVVYTLTLDEHCSEYVETPPQKRNGRRPRRQRELYVDADLRGTRKHLRMLCHAIVHAMAPKSPEPWVELAGDTLGRVLWQAGYRLKDQ